MIRRSTLTIHAYPSSNAIAIRRYDRADAQATLQVFREAVRRGAAELYDEAKRLAWAPTLIDLREWTATRGRGRTWVAEKHGEVVGFIDLDIEGLIGMLYVHPEHAREGIGGALLDEVERAARELDISKLRVQASLVAQPLLRRKGFIVVQNRLVERRGEWLAQAKMEKVLEPVA